MQTTDPSFTNSAVTVDDLPDYSAAELEPVAPRFRRYLIFSTLLYAAIPLLVSGFSDWIRFINIGIAWVTFVPLVVVFSLILLYRLADARHRGWALREHDLIAQSGVWWRSVTTLPIARIQHVESSNGPLERKLDLARLSCFTAGGITADLVVIALEAETADRLREHLLEQIRERDAQAREAEQNMAIEPLIDDTDGTLDENELDFLEQLEADATEFDLNDSESKPRG